MTVAIDAASCSAFPFASQTIIPFEDSYCFRNSNCDLVNHERLRSLHAPLPCERPRRTGKLDKSVGSTNMSRQPLSGGVFRPKGALARTLYEKHNNDCKLRELDKQEWYRCDLAQVSPEIRDRFFQLSPDEDTRAFISNSIEKSSWVWTQLWHCLAKSIMGFFMTRTDINGWLGRGSMFVLSAEQLRGLLQFGGGAGGAGWGALADVGAGDGEVTARWAPLFSELYATEMSCSMRRLLQSKGFRVLDTETWWSQQKFNVISMLNLLDRCAEPRTMLLTARQALLDEGVMIIALVLPFKPYVEYRSDHMPLEQLPIFGDSFEEQVSSFVEYARLNIGLSLSAWARVPYLCEGDINQSYYWLDNAIFVFRKDITMYRNTS